MNTIHGFIAFLRCEANLAEERAKQLRLTISLIEANGRGPKKKRKRDSNKTITKTLPMFSLGYSLYLQTHLEELKKVGRADADDEAKSREAAVNALTRQWTHAEKQEKQAWQFRAEQLKQAEAGGGTSHFLEAPTMVATDNDVIEESGLPEPPSAEGDDWGSRKRPAKTSGGDDEDDRPEHVTNV